MNQKHIFENKKAVSGRDRFVYSVLEKIPYKKFYSDEVWQTGYAVRVGQWKFYNYGHIVGVRKCKDSGFNNKQLFNELKDAYSNHDEYESYMERFRNVQEPYLKNKYKHGIYNRDHLSSGTDHWQLYNLKLDPFEANNLFDFERVQSHIDLGHQKVELALSGELKESYIKYDYNLTAASIDIFDNYMNLEKAKGYQGPFYPHKMWTTIFETFATDATSPWYDPFMHHMGFLRPKSRIFAKDFCEDLSLIRTRLDDYRSSRNSSEYYQNRNRLFHEMDIRYIQKYL